MEGSQKAASKRGAETSTNNGSKHKHSMCSSELESRVEAMRIQLEEERKRRLDVEKQIQNLILTRGGPQAAAVAKILKESDLQSLAAACKQHNNNNKPGSVSGASVRSVSSSQRSAGVTSSSYGRQVLPPINNSNSSPTSYNNNNNNSNNAGSQTIPQPPARRSSQLGTAGTSDDIVSKCEKEAADCDKLIRQLSHDHAAVLSRKPPLPTAARGIASRNTGGGAFGCDYVMARRSKATPAQLYMMNQWHQERMDKINAFTFGIAGGGGSY